MARATTSRDASRKTAQAILTAINRKHGDGTVVVASEARIKPPRLSTGSLSLDVALGGGWPVNQWSEVVGLESAGKTTIVLKTIAAAMARDPDFRVAWVAAESYDEDWAAQLGVDNARIYLIEENIMEVAYEAVLDFVANRACDMVVIDSLPALVPSDEDEKSMEEWSPGAGARRTNQFMRKATKATKRSLVDDDRPVVGVIINQWRSKITQYGDPRTTPCGMAKNFWMYARLDVKRDEWLYEGSGEDKHRVGQAIKVNVFKMKGARPGAPATVHFYFADSNGVAAGNYDVCTEMLNLALLYDIVVRRGNGYAYDGVRYAGGKSGFYAALREDATLYARVRKEVLDVAQRKAIEAPAEEDPEEEQDPPARALTERQKPNAVRRRTA